MFFIDVIPGGLTPTVDYVNIWQGRGRGGNLVVYPCINRDKIIARINKARMI